MYMRIAIIFDMDGVLVDSEPLWRRAMVRGFTELGINFTEEDCRRTTGKRFNDVVSFWIDYHKIQHVGKHELETRIIDYLIELINSEGKAIEGVEALIDQCKKKGLALGLATSSSTSIIRAVLKKLNLGDSFSAVTSAEHLAHGKPHPEVFLQCAAELGYLPSQCIVIEDSLNGVIAALAAQMRVIAVPDAEHAGRPQFYVASKLCATMQEAGAAIDELCGREYPF